MKFAVDSRCILYCGHGRAVSRRHRTYLTKSKIRMNYCSRRISGIVARLIVLFCIITMLSACGGPVQQRNRIDWSPDGNQALFFASDGVRLIREEGKITKVLLDKGTGEPNLAAWTPDGEHFVGVMRDEIRDWNELKQFIPKAEQKRITAAARLRSRLVSSGKSLGHLSKQERADWDKAREGLLESEIHVYLASNKEEEINDRWMEMPPGNKVLATAFLDSLRLYRVSNSTIEPGPVLYRTRRHIDSLAVSPKGDAVAGVESFHSFKPEPLMVITPIDPKLGKPLVIPPSVSEGIAWCPDNESILFIKKVGSVGALQLANVLDADGKLLMRPKIRKLLSLPGFQRDCGIHCTKDGTIYVSSPDLPTEVSPGANPQKLFKLMLGKSPILERIVPDKFFVTDSCELFRVSPDGRSIAVLKPDGTVDVFDTINGVTIKAQCRPFVEEQYHESAFLPDWRNNDQLCFCAPIEDSKSARVAGVMLWSLADRKMIDISSGWPAEAANFLNRGTEESD